MSGYPTGNKIIKWTNVIFSPEDDMVPEIKADSIKFEKLLTEKIAISLFEDLGRQGHLFNYPGTAGKNFTSLTAREKAEWIRRASDIPEKLSSLGLLLRPFTSFCRTCIITDKEIEMLARRDHGILYREFTSKAWEKGKSHDPQTKITPVLYSFSHLPGSVKRYFMEANYLIPVELKKAGYEIIRMEELAEINEQMVRKIARAIHSRYVHEINRHGTKSALASSASGFYISANNKNGGLSDFDDLPDEIKYSNTDNAYHIPAKLLAIGYKIRPAGKGFKPVALHLGAKEVETMAKVEHIRWSWDKRLNGWTYGSKRDNINKIHPGLLPYELLKESEKEKDRELVSLIPSLLKDIGYVAYPVNPNRIRNLSYAIKPQSSIHRILDETNRMNMQIRRQVKLSPELEEMVEKRNRKIEEAINEIEGSYNYARHIQETFLPDNLFVRECFPESFILYKPKDIVSGDFYFFSKQENLTIFAVADCTGHGIPGALISTLGYGILDQAVNEIKLTDTSQILQHLYSRIHRFLRNEEGAGVPDDMDIVLCTLDSETNILTYSSVKNPFYRISKGEFFEYRDNSFSEDYRNEGECRFKTYSVELRRGDTLYLFSDGFTDQFGGTNHKKYQTSRFKSLLMNMHNLPMAEQGDLLFAEIEKWREEKAEDQTDDILVIGISI